MRTHLSSMRRNRESGTALLVALTLTVIFLGFTMALLGIALSHSTDSLTSSAELKALFAAEGGLNEAIADLNRGGTGNVTGAIDGIPFDARAVHVADRYLIDSVGTNRQYVRAVRTAVVPALPVPVDRAAITFVGPSGKAAALDTTITRNGNVLISGQSAQLPAVGVEDPTSYTTIMEDLIPKIASGQVSANTFRGTPEVQYTAADGSTASVPVLPLPTPEWDAEKLEALRLKLIDKVVNGLMPKASTTYRAGASSFNTPTDIGPGVTVIDGASLNVNSNVNGSGILIINGGSLNVTQHNQFHWDGTVFIVGKSGAGAQMVNSGGDMQVQGNVIVLGNQGSQSDLTIGSDYANSNTLINGAVLLMAGTNPNDGARFEVGSGGVNMHGWVGVFGGTSQIGATNTQGVFNVLGSMTVGVDGAHPQDGLAEVDFDGNVHVQYNQNHLDRAIAGLLGLIQMLQLPPPTYREEGWMEISPLVAYQPSADALQYTQTAPTLAYSSSSSSTAPSTAPSTSASTTTGGQGSLRVGGGSSGAGGKGKK